MAKKKYEKPELVDLNEKNVVQGRCESGSVNLLKICRSGASAPNGNCNNGTSAGASNRCRTGGNIS